MWSNAEKEMTQIDMSGFRDSYSIRRRAADR